MTNLRPAVLRCLKLATLTGSILFSCALVTGCGGGQTTKVEVPENPTPLPDDSMKVEIGHTASPKGRDIEAR